MSNELYKDINDALSKYTNDKWQAFDNLIKDINTKITNACRNYGKIDDGKLNKKYKEYEENNSKKNANKKFLKYALAFTIAAIVARNSKDICKDVYTIRNGNSIPEIAKNIKEDFVCNTLEDINYVALKCSIINPKNILKRK